MICNSHNQKLHSYSPLNLIFGIFLKDCKRSRICLNCLPSGSYSHLNTSFLRNYIRYGNINPFPISYDFRPRLRGRLTLG